MSIEGLPALFAADLVGKVKSGPDCKPVICNGDEGP